MFFVNIKQKIGFILFGIFLSLVIIEVLLRLSAFVYLSWRDYDNKMGPNKEASERYRILCLGESTTALGGENSYPAQLERVLNQRQTERRFKVINEGVPGTDTFNILSELEYNLYRYKPDMVAVMMGINDTEDSCRYKDGWEMVKSLIRDTKVYSLWKFFEMSLSQEKTLKEIYLKRADVCLARQRYSRAEEMLKLAAEIDPDDYQIYVEWGVCYKEEGKFDLAQEMFEKAVRLSGGDFNVYMELAAFYRGLGRYAEAEQAIKNSLVIEPRNRLAYTELGWCYSDDGKPSLAEENFKKVIELYPDDAANYMDLGRFYSVRKRNKEAQETFFEALRLARGEDVMWAYLELAASYKEEGRPDDAEDSFRKAIASCPGSDTAYIEFGSYYQEKGNYLKAEEMFNKALELKENNPEVYNYLGSLNQLLGRREEAERYFRREKFLRWQYKLVTRNNYRKLKRIVMEKGIKLVCLQYPLRLVEGLKLMFDSPKGIIFVDNKEVFKEALRDGSYEDYFEDRFAGDFGHCTAKGNYIMAENVAKSILKHLSDK